jgi:hypothetical protein
MIATLLLLLAADAPASAPAALPSFQDPFAGKLQDGWAWVREEPTSWRIDEQGLHVRAMKGTLWKSANDAHNVLLRALPDGTAQYALEVTVTSKPAAGGEQAGIIAYRDDDNYTKIVRESLEGRTWVVFGRENAGKGEMIARLPLDAESVRLRLVILPSGATGSVRDPAGQWKEVGHSDLLGDVPSRVGVVAHGAPADAERWARFNDFQIARP